MSFFDGFVGGAAEQGTNVLNNQMAEDRAQRMATFNAQLEESKLRTVEALKLENLPKELNARADAANAGLNRFGLIVSKYANQEKPVEAVPVTDLPGHAPNQQGDTGMVGNYEHLKGLADKLPPEDRQPYLAQLARDQTTAAKDAVAGKTQKLSADEALKMAMDEAMRTDPAALADYESRLGKPQRDERRVDNQDANTNRMLDIKRKFNEDQASWQRTMADIAEKRAQRQEDKSGIQMEKAEMQSTRQALSTVLKDIGTQEDKIQMKMMDPMMTPEQKSMLEIQFKTLDQNRLQARGELMKLAGVEIQSAPKQDVRVGGKVIGQAANSEDAAKLVSDWKANRPTPALPGLIGSQPKPVEQDIAKPARTADAALDTKQPFSEDPILEKKMAEEQMAMGEGRLLRYSPEVKAYAEAKKKMDRDRTEEENKKRSEDAAKKANELRKKIGY